MRAGQMPPAIRLPLVHVAELEAAVEKYKIVAIDSPASVACVDESGVMAHAAFYNPPQLIAIDVYWGSGSPYSWRVLLALEYKKFAVQQPPASVREAGAQVAADARSESRGRVPSREGRRLRRVRVAGGPLLPRPQVSRPSRCSALAEEAG